MKDSVIRLMVRNYMNVFIFGENKITKQTGGSKKFTIEYNNFKYSFEQLYDDENTYILYTYDNSEGNCVILNIDKKLKHIVITSLGSIYKCYHEEIDIGSNLLKITLKMIKKYYKKLGVNTIVLTDNTVITCKDNNKSKIKLGQMLTLLTGHTWYGKYGFRPYTNDFKLDYDKLKLYDQNTEIMNTVKLKDINFEKYLIMINKKYQTEFTSDIVNEFLLLIKNNKEKLLKEFLQDFHDKNSFDISCKYFEAYYEQLFTDLKLNNIGKIYGLKLE